MKHELYYVLSAAIEGLERDTKIMQQHLNELDPIAAIPAQYRLASMKGVLAYMKERLSDYERE